MIAASVCTYVPQARAYLCLRVLIRPRAFVYPQVGAIKLEQTRISSVRVWLTCIHIRHADSCTASSSFGASSRPCHHRHLLPHTLQETKHTGKSPPAGPQSCFNRGLVRTHRELYCRDKTTQTSTTTCTHKHTDVITASVCTRA